MSSRDFMCNPINYNIYSVETINSTNTYLKENYNLYLDNTVLIANKQTNGRGRFDRVWISDNDICFSILFKKFHYNNVIAPLAITLALNELNIVSGIKWPNDILIDNKKLAGILIEDIYSNDFLASVVGIGINMTDKPDFNGIGLNSIINVSKNEMINLILKHYNSLLDLEFKELVILYKKYSMILEKNVLYKDNEYIASDITEKGYLVLQGEKDTIIVSSNEIGIKTIKTL